MNPETPRRHLVQVRCTAAEVAQWQAQAEAAGVTLSDLVRSALAGQPVRRRKRVDVDPALLRELARIGSNLNQLAHWANRDRQGVPAVAVLARLVEIDRELAALRSSVTAHAD